MLTIYKASAGSGKTHKLTGEYLQLLFKTPENYRHVLAVTFTNKATDEMKSRIMEELYHLGSGAPSDYMGTLKQETGKSEDVIRKLGKEILIRILHDFGAFNISTIDRFFQQTIRSFTREIGLQGGYGIEMDTESVLSEATDRLLLSLDQPGNNELIDWMIRFAEDKIEDGGGWNIRNDILKLGKEIFKEKYKVFGEELSKRLADKKVLSSYIQTLNRIIKQTEDESRKLGEEGLRLIAEYGLEPIDFKGGSKSGMRFFDQLASGACVPPGKSFQNFLNEVESWYTAKTPADLVAAITRAYSGGLYGVVESVMHFFSSMTYYNTAREIVRYYYTLGILSDLSIHVAAWRDEKNKMLIADTTELLNRVIDGSDVPFIYEKIGTRIGYYMIDEFQDTSRMQWENFLPLLKDSLAYKNPNLLVGDVKQSIYRFRNSDWTLLSEQVDRDFDVRQVKKETLMVNWRSFREIVLFNNELFESAPQLLQQLLNEQLAESSLVDEKKEELSQTIIHAYSESAQQVAPKLKEKEGHVQLHFISDTEEEKAPELILNQLPETIEQLQKNGYEPKDIAVLVRRNKEGAQVAEALLAYKMKHPESPYTFDIVSDEALFVSSASSVRFLISLFRHLDRPKEDSLRQIVWINLQLLNIDGEPIDQTVLDEKIKTVTRHSLYETAQHAYMLFFNYFPPEEQAYIQSFLDMCIEFAPHDTADLGNFIRWWDETGHRATVITPDSQNAIRILTIHKSKGLGFKAVIIPFANWELDHSHLNSPILWCQTSQAPFDALPLVPILYGKGLTDTFFSEDYFEEKMQTYMDSLNTLYVAFTRAKEELIVFAPISKGDSLRRVSDLLLTTVQNSITLSSKLREEEENNRLFEAGSWCKSQSVQEDSIAQLPLQPILQTSPDKRMHLRLRKSSTFFNDTNKQHGILMHEILSEIRTEIDIHEAVTQRYMMGEIEKGEVSQLIETLHQLINSDGAAEWFSDQVEVMNEATILTNSGRTYRPDRIINRDGVVSIIDYKFGEVQDKRYPSQIRRYMRLIRQMGYKEVHGYLWYASLGVIEEVVL